WPGQARPWRERGLALRQSEHVERVAVQRMAHIRFDGPRDIARAAAAKTGGYGDILLAVDAETHREALHRGAQPRLPQLLARRRVESMEGAVEITDKRDAAIGRQHAGQPFGPPIAVPLLLHGADAGGG